MNQRIGRMSELFADPQIRTFAIAILILDLSLFLLTFNLSQMSVWVDEGVSLNVARQPMLSAVIQGVIEAERRPPLYHLLLHIWLRLAGDSDLAARWFSVLLTLGCVGLTWGLGRELGEEGASLVAAYLLALSPFFMLYSRIIRYYSLVLFLSMLSSLFYVKLPSVVVYRQRGSLAVWAGYLFSTGALLYTEYGAISLLLAQNLWLLLRWRKHRRTAPVRALWLRWIEGQIVLGILFLSWSLVAFRHATRGGLAADFAQSPLGFLIKLGYPFYSFSVGETIFPWQLAAIVGVPVALFLIVLGWLFWNARREAGGLFLGLFVAVPVLFTALVFSFLAPDVTFLSAASRTSFAAPFFFLLVAGGVKQVHGKWQLLTLFVLTLTSGYGLRNYYAGQMFHNPIYVIPMRQIVHDVVGELQPGDVVLSDEDSMFAYYCEQNSAVNHFFSPETQKLRAWATAHPTARVWLITLGRDRSRLVDPSAETVKWLDQGYEVVPKRGYVEQDRTYRRFKEFLLKRPAYQYKVLVRLYQRRTE